MNKEELIRMVARLIQEAGKHGEDYGWMYMPHNTLEPLCEALKISVEEIQDTVGGYK